EPDRSRAIEMYLVAWKAGRHLATLVRARALCIELGDLATAAKIARLQHQHRPEPSLLVEEGLALLDAGQRDLAVRPLAEAARLRPDERGIALALAVARGEWPDVGAAAEQLLGEARAQGPGSPGAELLLHAARVVHLHGGEPARYGQLLAAAFECDPRMDRAYALHAAHLTAHGSGDQLLAVYRRRIEHAPSLAARYEDLRRAGVRLVLEDTQPGLGLRLLDRALREAYGHELSPVPGQIASLELLRRHA